MYRVRDGAIQFREELKLYVLAVYVCTPNTACHREVLQGATELRLLLCKEKRTTTRISSSTVAACGTWCITRKQAT